MTENTKILEYVIAGIPYPQQIKDIEFEEGAIRFTWRANRFRISKELMCETVGSGVLIGSDVSILLGAIVKNAFLNDRSESE